VVNGSEHPTRPAVRLLLVSGSTRGASTNTATVRTAAAIAPPGRVPTVFEALAQLPAFNPDDDHDPLPPAVAELRREIAAADVVVFCTPEYAGALPGSFKNLLDWTVGGSEMYGKPVAWINVAAEGRGDNAHASLATVLGYLGTRILERACVRLFVPRQSVGPDGLIGDERVRAGIAAAVETIAREATVGT
jgi:chromate reductase